MAAIELGSVQLEVEDDRNKYDVEKSHDESCFNGTLQTNPKQATNANVDSLNIVKALQPLLGILKKDPVNEEKRAESVLERAFSKLGLHSEEIFHTQRGAELRTESSWYEYVEGIVRGCGDAFWMKVRHLISFKHIISSQSRNLYAQFYHSFILLHMQVAQKTQSLNVAKLDAIIEVLIDSLADTLGGIDETLLWILEQKQMPEFMVS